VSDFVVTGLVALAFAAVHVFGKHMRLLRVTPRSIWLSFAGGVSLAYVFVHVLPELAAWQGDALREIGTAAGLVEVHLYLTGLAGLLVFYGLERFVRSARTGSRAGQASPTPVFWLHLGSYAAYSLLIGYLLVHRKDTDPGGLLMFAVALGLHFVVNDQALRESHGRLYDRSGRWLLALAPPLGWLLGILTSISTVAIANLFAFLAGGIILNVLKEELPEDRESRFWALLAGALGFAALLLLAR
jgi:zinc transporter ZupT